MADELEIPDGKISDKLLLSILRDIRREQRETTELLVSLTRHLFEVEKRLSRRMDETQDDLALTLKSEVLGRLANFETRIDRKIEELLGDA
jgi:hypothetical protein